MKKPSIAIAPDVSLDGRTLIDTRLLVTGNSGCGKSWILRLVAEGAMPCFPTIILDPEGEFSTLREHVDAVLVGPGGEVMPTLPTAAKLARKLLELGVSAIVDLYDMPLGERRAYVRVFLESLMSAPKRLWRPCPVILDESHRFAPERSAGQAECTDAVISLLSQGRKRGLCGILATQRISKLHKDAAAECVNNLIGRTTLDVDVHRARDILGIGKSDEAKLKSLRPGQWYGFGPAFPGDGAVIEMRAQKVATTHPQAGQRHRIEPPAPSARIKKVLPELAELPKAVQAEQDELSRLRSRVRDLEREAKGKTVVVERPKVDREAIDKAIIMATNRERQAHAKALRARLILADKVSASAAELANLLRSMIDVEQTPVLSNGKSSSSVVQAPQRVLRTKPTDDASDTALGGGLRRIMVALAQNPDGCDRKQLGLLAHLSPGSGTFATYLAKLRSMGYATDHSGKIYATPEGVAALGHFDPLPTGDGLVTHWKGYLGSGGLGRMFLALVEAGHHGLSRSDLAKAADLAVKSGTFATYLAKLRSLKLAEGKDPIIVSAVFR